MKWSSAGVPPSPGNQSRLSRCVYQETRLKLAPLAGVHKIETPPAVVDLAASETR
jgi:hypothetical protein